MKKHIFILLFFSSTFIFNKLKASILIESNSTDSTQLILNNWREKDSLALWLNTQKKLSQEYRSQNKFTEGLSILNTAINNIWRKAKTDKEQTQLAWIYVNRAYLFEVDGFFLEAQTDYIEADKIFIQLSVDNYNTSRFIWHPLGNIYTRLGENKLAAYYIQKSLKKYDELNATSDLMDACNDLGIIYINQGNFNQAIKILEKGIQLETKNDLNNALLYSNIADAQYSLNKFDQAFSSIDSTLYYLKKAATFHSKSQYYTELIKKYLMNSYTLKGKLLLGIKQTDNADKEFQKALHYQSLFKDEKHRQIAKVFLGLAQSQILQNRPIKALNKYQRALKSLLLTFNDSNLSSNPSPHDLYAEVLIGEALLGKADAAKLQYDIDSNFKWLLAAEECFQLYFSWEKRIRSEYYHESSKLKFTQELHQATESALELFKTLHELQPQAGWAKQAFLCIEQSKGVVLSESTVNLFQRIPELRNDSVLHQLQLLKKQYRLITSSQTDENDRLEKLQDNILLLESDLKTRFPYYSQLKSQANNTISPILLLKHLEQQEAELVSYFIGSDVAFCVLVRNRQFQLYSINKAQYNLFVEGFSVVLKNPKQKAPTYEKAAYNLYRILFPFDTINQAERLIILPDEQLNTIPFEALVDRKRQNSVHFKNLHYQVNSRTISYSPSAKFLLRRSHMSSPPKPFLGIAPNFKNSSKASLAYSTEEVSHGKNIFGGEVLTGNSIQKEELISKLSDYQIVHWVSHAGLDSCITDGAWISVNPENTIEAKLFPPELLAVQLSTPLLTLNACETAAGKYKPGEGVYSLSRSFAYAGAQNIVTNLWQANHRVNNQLMNQFYTTLKQGENIAFALTTAKRKFLQLESTDEFGAHPYFWAAPILIGNNKLLSINTTPSSSSFWNFFGFTTGLLLLLFVLYKKFRF